MNRKRSLLALACLSVISAPAWAEVKPAELMKETAESLVVIQFTYEGELGKRDFTGMATIVREDGTAIFSIDMSPRQLPDEQMTDFKFLMPGDSETEYAAEFLGRDERFGISYARVKPGDDKSKARKWKPIKFVDKPVAVGDQVHAVGLLPKLAGYNPYFTSAPVSAILKGPIPTVLVGGSGLSVIGSPVLNDAGEAVGFVNSQPDRTVLLNDPRTPYATVENPTRLFTPASDFIPSFDDIPVAGEAPKLAFIGITNLSGLNKDTAEYYGLKGKVAIQFGDVIPGFSADRAGLKKGDIVVSLNGNPLEKGDIPEEAPQIFTRTLGRMKVGEKVTLGIVSQRGAEPKSVEVTLDDRPAQANKAARFYAEDLGFTSREVVFEDTYVRKLPKETTGVVLTFVRPQSAAQAAQMQPNDFVQLINQTPVKDVKQFKEVYQAFRKEKPNEAVVLEVLRGANTQIIRIEPPRE